MKVICNTTPFIALASINQIGLLKDIYSTLITPKAVIEEVSVGGAIRVQNLASLDWIEVVPNVVTVENRILFQLDYGERQVVLNALELEADLVLIDDRNARNIAEYLGLQVKGTLGVLVEAKRKGLILSFRETALKMKEQGIHFSEKLVNEIASNLKETF
jgi:predicted nucleic acid-binding protein